MNSIIMNFDDTADMDAAYNQLKELFPNAETLKKSDEFDDFLFASESSLAFWDNEIDDEVWNNV